MKHIKFEIVDVVKDEVHVRITEQSHRGKEFGNDGERFKASNKHSLLSLAVPCVDSYFWGTCVQGSENEYDNDILVFTLVKFAQFRQAVAEYNEYFKDWSDVKDEKDEKEPRTRPIDETKFKIGDWVYHIHAQKYVKITEIDIEKKLYRFEAKDDIDGDLVVIFYVLPARKRLKDIFEAYGLMGKVYISGTDTFCLVTSIKCRDGLYINGIHSRHFEEGGECKFINDLSVYEFEHLKNGEWVK